VWACAVLMTLPSARAAEFHVAVDGDDAHPGTREQPFRTLQRAAAIMAPGDTCTVGGGLYRETVRPAHSGTFDRPICFMGATGETVTVTGADECSGAEVYSGSVYCVKAGPIFQVLMDDAPAAALDAMPGQAMDLRGAWWLNPEGTLYFRCPLNEEPDAGRVSIQTRRWAFDLSGLGFVHLRNLAIHAAGINLSGARYCRVEACQVWWAGGRGEESLSGGTRLADSRGPDAAILIGGMENDVTHSTLVGSTGDGIVLLPGSVNNRVTEVLVRGAGGRYADGCGLVAAGTANQIRNVTVADCAGGALLCRNLYNARILHNDFSRTGRDGTGRAIVRVTGDGKGTIVAYNWIHDNAAGEGDGILLEGPAENYILHHNVIWGQPRDAFRLKGAVRYCFVFNNTCALNGSGIDVEGPPVPGQLKSLRFFNNLFAGVVWKTGDNRPADGVIWESNYVGTAPGFLDAAARKFALAPDSPCIDAGQDEAELTDEYTGKNPDAGAFEFGRDYPVPGRSAR
jgi:hypothetical protein